MKKKKLKSKQKNQLLMGIPAALIVILMTYLFISGTSTVAGKNANTIQIDELPQENYRIDYVFWSDCGACYNLTQALNDYLAGKNFIDLNMIPATGGGWTSDARIFHTFSYLADDNNMHVKRIYNAYVNEIHAQRNIQNPNDKVSFLSNRLNVSDSEFETAMYSDEVERRIEESRTINNKLNVRSVPQLVINGKYKLNMQSFSGYDEIFTEIERIFKEES